MYADRSARCQALFSRAGVQGIGCRVYRNLAHPTENRLKHPTCDVTRIAELVRHAKTAKARNARERRQRKAIAAAAEYSKRGPGSCQAVRGAFEAGAKALLKERPQPAKRVR